MARVRTSTGNTYNEDACSRCDFTTMECVTGMFRFARGLHLACACGDDCGAVHCAAKDVKVAG